MKIKNMISRGIKKGIIYGAILLFVSGLAYNTKKYFFKKEKEKIAILFAGDTEIPFADKTTENSYLINLASNYCNLTRLGYDPDNIHIFFPESVKTIEDDMWGEKIEKLRKDKGNDIRTPSKKNLYSIVDSIENASKQGSNLELLVVLDGHGVLVAETVSKSPISIALKSYYITGEDTIEDRMYSQDFENVLSKLAKNKVDLILNFCYSGFLLKDIKINRNVNLFASDSGTRTIRDRYGDFARTFFEEMLNPDSDKNKDKKITLKEAYSKTFEKRKEYIMNTIDELKLFDKESSEKQKIRALPSSRISKNRIVYKCKMMGS